MVQHLRILESGNTQGIKVAVANVDKGTDNALLGKVNLGDQIEDTLKDNDQLGWEFMEQSRAMEAVQSGDCYAAIIIPSVSARISPTS